MAATPADGAPTADISVVATAVVPAAASCPSRDAAEYLFAAFFALAVLTIVSPARTLHTLLPWGRIALLPLATCQDLFLLAAIAWLFHGLFAIAKRPWSRRMAAIAGWTICLWLALYSYLNQVLYLIIHRPLTFGLLAAADNLRGIQSSIDAVVTPALIATLAMAPAYVVLIAIILARFAPAATRRMSDAFHSVRGLSLTVIFLVGAHTWAIRYVPFSLASFNPQWTLISSALGPHTPLVTDAAPDGYLADFQPVGMRPASAPGRLAEAGLVAVAPRKPLNVLIESGRASC